MQTRPSVEEGARRAGGRFNSPGRPVAYTSESLALARLEILVNLPTDRLLSGYVTFRTEIPGLRIESLKREELPENGREATAPKSVMDIGNRWLQSKRSLALRVPSAALPAESNVLISPKHPAFEEIGIEGPSDPEIDDRLQ